MSISEETKHKIQQELYEKHGTDLLNLEKCKEIYQNLLEKKIALEQQVDISNESAYIGETIKNAEIVVNKSLDCIEKAKDITKKITKELEDVREVRATVTENFNKLYVVQTAQQYMRIIQHIEFLNAELEQEFGKKDDEHSATIFANLTEISRNLLDSPAENLRNYLRESIHYWHDVLKEKLSKDFAEVLKLIKWPFVSANFSLVTPLPNHIERLQVIAEYLLQIEIPSESSIPTVKAGILSDFPNVSLPIHFLIEPLRKRFIYHFYGTRQTNRSDKPEWYFTQILTWIRDHRNFVGQHFQPVIDKLGLHHIDAQLEFSRGLVQLAVEKLNSEIPHLQFDDFTFSHSVDEALGFDKELRETYLYPPHQPSVIVVLTQAQVFVKWLAMEKKYAIEKMDAMLSPNALDAFEPLTSDVEDLKITTCADAFITLLQTITDRYELLPQPGHRLQFLELQLELLDDFRVRLLQIVNAEEGDIIESKIPMVANSIYYIENVLIDWGAMLHYLNLYYYRAQLESGKQIAPASPNGLDDSPVFDIESDTVFGETLSLYRRMLKDLLYILSETVLNEVRTKSKRYRRERWSTMKVEKEFKTFSLTPTACPMFEVLARRLHQLQKCLQSKLFTLVWRNIASHLDNYLFQDVIMDNRFNDGGATQLKFDVIRNLFPLFAQFSDKPQNYFTQTTEAINLLNISKGSALLLRETLLALEGATGVEDTRGKALKEVGVTNFTPKEAVEVLNQRIDITINRLVID